MSLGQGFHFSRSIVGSIAILLTLGCSFSAGGWSLCLLDHSDLTLTVSHPHADPNAPGQ